MPLLLGLVVLVLALWALSVVSKVDPRVGARVLKASGGLLSLGLAAFLGLRGEIGVAIPLGIFGLSLLGWLPFGASGFSARTQKSAGASSRVRTRFVEMQLDHDSGTMRGRFVDGPHRGADLDQLSIKALGEALVDVDEETRALLVAYLDRRDPGWREDTERDAATGPRSAASGKMTEQEAYQILGLQRGASSEAIARAHRTLMKKVHPDQGGSTYLAARINEAKEILSRRHR